MTRDLQQELTDKISALTPDQRDRLVELLEVLMANRNGSATEADIVRCIMALPTADAQSFTDILQTSINK